MKINHNEHTMAIIPLSRAFGDWMLPLGVAEPEPSKVGCGGWLVSDYRKRVLTEANDKRLTEPMPGYGWKYAMWRGGRVPWGPTGKTTAAGRQVVPGTVDITLA